MCWIHKCGRSDALCPYLSHLAPVLGFGLTPLPRLRHAPFTFHYPLARTPIERGPEDSILVSPSTGGTDDGGLKCRKATINMPGPNSERLLLVVVHKR